MKGATSSPKAHLPYLLHPSPNPLTNQCLKHLPLGGGKTVLCNVMSKIHKKAAPGFYIPCYDYAKFGMDLESIESLTISWNGNSLLGVCFPHTMFLATLHSSKVIALGFYP